jgi:hypothetical protein
MSLKKETTKVAFYVEKLNNNRDKYLRAML